MEEERCPDCDCILFDNGLCPRGCNVDDIYEEPLDWTEDLDYPSTA